jgi:uncharacterized membrane protein YoaK (UPF0700 family)
MQPNTPDKVFTAQPGDNAVSFTTELVTPVYTILFAIIGLPLIFVVSIFIAAIYQRYHTRLLKQQAMSLEKSWQVSYKAK